MKRKEQRNGVRRYLLTAAAAAFCLSWGITAMGAPGSGEHLTAGVGEILDALPETDGAEEEAAAEEDAEGKEAEQEEAAEEEKAGQKEAEEETAEEEKAGQKEAEEEAAEEETAEDGGPAADKRKTPETKEDGSDSFRDELVMTDVSDVLNVREEPSEEAQKVGYLYADCGGTILERKDGWTKLESGELVGWAKDEYLLFGEDAVEELEDVGRLIAHVTGETLRIRKEPSTDAQVYDLAAQGDTLEVVNKAQFRYSDGIELDAEWAAVDYEGETGYVSSEFIEIDFEYDHGETLEQIAARQQTEEEAQEKKSSSQAKTRPSPGRQNAGSIPAGTSDVTLLAALIQCEAGNESYEGQLAVGAVVVNRVKSPSYPNTVTDVIFASGQFTPAGSGKVARLIESGNIYASCIQAANEALSGVTNVGSATHFRRAGGRDGIVIGNHVFW